MFDQDTYNPYYEKFKERWEEVTTKLKNSGVDLSKIKITKEVSYDSRASKRDS